MTPRELIEKWERDALDSCRKRDMTEFEEDHRRSYLRGYENAKKEDAAELRAALPEQPLSRKWREEAEKLLETARNRYEQGFAYGRLKSAADLDSHESELRELLREAAYWLEWGPAVKAIAMADRIRKHLEGDSDAE